MMRTQPPGFRWLVGGFAVLAGCAFLVRFYTDDDRPSLVFAVICLLVAGYWLLFDTEPPESGDGERRSRPEPGRDEPGPDNG